MAHCIFCQIAKKELPAKIAHETPGTIAFYDVNPQAPVHILVIPKEHIPGFMEVEEGQNEIIGELLNCARQSARMEGMDKTGFRAVFNYGPDAGQAVDHLHLHILGKRKLKWPPG